MNIYRVEPETGQKEKEWFNRFIRILYQLGKNIFHNAVYIENCYLEL